MERHTREVFRLPDILAIAPEPDCIIENRAFEMCDFYGPALLAFISDVKFDSNKINGNINAVLWEVKPPRAEVTGCFGLRGCEFVDCAFTRIGFAGPPELIRQFKSAMRK